MTNKTTANNSLGFLLSDVTRLMRRAFQQRLENSSLTFAQARVLLAISRREGIRQIELAEALEVQAITLARWIDQLAQQLLVERRADPTDRRAYQLYLLPAAAEPLAMIETVIAAVREDTLRHIDENQTALVIAALNQLRNNLIAR